MSKGEKGEELDTKGWWKRRKEKERMSNGQRKYESRKEMVTERKQTKRNVIIRIK